MYGEELRKKVITLIEQGKSQQEVGDFLGINPRTIRHWVHQLKTQGTLAPQTHKERHRKINKEQLRAYVEENPDKTLMELGEAFQVSHVSIFHSLKKMSITLKKNPWVSRAG